MGRLEDNDEKGKTSQMSEMFLLSSLSRKARADFNRGWNDAYDVGLLNEVVNAEVQILFMLRKTGAISSWDHLLSKDMDPIPRIRILRRAACTMAAFATCVGAVMLNNMQTRPTVRPTKAVLQRAAVDAGLQFQMFIHVAGSSRFDIQTILHKCCGDGDKDPEYMFYLADYNVPDKTDLPEETVRQLQKILFKTADQSSASEDDDDET